MELNRKSPNRHVLALFLLMLSILSLILIVEPGDAAPRDYLLSTLSTPRYVTAPHDLPRFEVHRGTGSPAEGYIFLSYYDYHTLGRNKAYLLILDSNAEPVYYNRLPGIPIAMDFKKQPNGQLTYYTNLPQNERFYALDSFYQMVGTYEAGNGYTTDLHDLQIVENGNALLLVHNSRTADLSAYGGSSEATVVDCIVQELDPQKNVVFEWNSAEHIDITDTNQALDVDLLRYIHCNSVEEDFDGNLLLSNRNLDEITKIDRVSGEIIWRLGGKKSDFSFINDNAVGFSVQHDARRLPNGNISVYDNGNYNIPRISRGAEYKIDLEAGTATLVKEYRTTPDTWALSLGNMQKLSNGNVVIGWGRSSKPMFTEFTEDGEMVLQMDAISGTGSYRIFRFPWQGYPSWPPLLIAQVEDDIVYLYFSWNGSTETVSYMVLGGQEENKLNHLATVARSGFETTYKFAAPMKGLWFFQVTPLDNQGQPGIPSNIASAVVGRQIIYLPVVLTD